MGWTVTEKENLHCKYIYKEDDGDISSREFDRKGTAQRVFDVSDFGRELIARRAGEDLS